MAVKPTVFDVEHPDEPNYDGSAASARVFLRGENPELYQDTRTAHFDPSLQYNTGSDRTYRPYSPKPGFGEKLNASVRQLNSMVNYNDQATLEAARKANQDVDIPDSVLIEGLPPEFQTVVLDEKYKYGATAATTLSDQIKEDIANNTVMDDLKWYESLGYSAGALLTDPTTYVAGASGLKVGVNASKVATKANLLRGSQTAKTLTTYGTAGFVESAAQNAPRLGGDHTYTVEDYQADLVVDTLVGTGLVYSGDKLLKGFKSYQTQTEVRRRAAQENIDNMQREMNVGKAEVADFKVNETMEYRAQLANVSEWQVPDNMSVAGSEFGTKLDEALEYPIFQSDNDMGWMSGKLTQLRSEVNDLNRFRNRIDMSDVVNHPAFRSPTKQNVADLVKLVDEKVAKAWKVTQAQQKVEAPRIELGSPVGREATSRGLSKDNLEAWETLVENGLASKREIGMNEYAYKLLTESEPVTRSKRPKDLAPEMSAVLRKIESERFQAAQMAKRKQDSNPANKPFATIAYSKDFDIPKLNTGMYQYKGAETKAAVKTHNNRENAIKPKRYYHGTLADFDEFQASSQSGGLLFFTEDPKIASKYATLESVGYQTMGKAESQVSLKLNSENFPNNFENGRLVRATDSELEDILFSADIHESDKILEDWKAGILDNAQAMSKYNDLMPELTAGGQVRMVALDFQKAYGTPEEPIPWKDAEKMGADELRKQGYDAVYVQEQGGYAIAVLDNAQIRNYYEAVEVAERMPDLVKSSDEVSVAEITFEIDNLKAAQAAEQVDAQVTIEGQAPVETPLTKLDLTSGKLESAEESAVAVVENPGVAKAVGESLLRKAYHKVTDAITDYHGSGEHKVYKDLLSPQNIKQFAARAVSQWGGITRDLATKFIESDNPAVNWVGTHLTEMGRGYGGDVMRKHTAGVIKESEYMRSISKIMPAYDKAVKEYAASKGSNVVGQMMSATAAGGRNKVADEFAKKFMLYMNEARLKRKLPDEPIIAKFAQQWNDYMGHNYDTLVQNRIAGFTGENRINNYVPQVWNVRHVQRLIRQNGDDVLELLRRAIRTEDAARADREARALVEWAKGETPEGYDGYLATNDARSIERINIDWNTEYNGLSILDMLETDTRKLSTNYSNRVAGWAGVSKASNGALTSYTDLSALKLAVYDHAGSLDDVMTVSDTIDQLFGRPVQGGLQDWQRSLKSATVLTKLGGLGSAQLIETGTVATRAVMESMGDPKFMKKLTQGLSPKETAQDLMEIQKLTGNDWDYHLINTEAEYYTEYDLAGTNKLQNGVDWAVDKATGGSLKQIAGRGFGHVTGYNAVRKYQAAMMQRSFSMQVARHFMFGNSKMSPARMADYGLTDTAGRNAQLQKTIRENVEFDADGYPTKYNFDKWDAEAKDTFMYAMQRAEAVELLRPLVGEMPEWFNKPWMQMLMQFRTMPIAAQNKALGRSLAFADKEAVVQLMLNTMTAGLVRYGKYAGMATVAVGLGEGWQAEYEKQLDRAGRDAILGGATDRYITQLGGVADVYSLAQIYGSANSPEEYARKAANQVPSLSLIGDYAGLAYATSQGDGDKALKHAQGIMFLGNSLAVEAAGSVIEETIKGD